MTFTTVTIVSTQSALAIGPSAIANLNYIGGKAVGISALTTASSGDFTIQYTFDDPTKVGGSSLATWSNLSTDPYTQLPSSAVTGIHYSASSFNTDGVLAFLPSPPAALRLNSSSLNGTVTLKVIQGDGWALAMVALGGSLLYHILNGAAPWMNLIA